MKKQYYILIPVAVISIVVTFASCAKKDNEYRRRTQGQQQVLSNEEGIEEFPSTSPSPAAAEFLVRLEGSTLTLYDTGGDEYTVLKSLNIDTSYYSYEDIKELIAGIPAYSKESGFEILENFTN